MRWNGDHIGSSMISIGSTGTARQVSTPKNASRKRVNTLTVGGAAARADRLARPHHVRRIDGIADHLQREIGLHAGAHVERAVLHQRPAAMRALRCGADSWRSWLRVRYRRARRDSGAAAHIPPGSCCRLPARTPSARRIADSRAAPASPRRSISPARRDRLPRCRLPRRDRRQRCDRRKTFRQTSLCSRSRTVKPVTLSSSQASCLARTRSAARSPDRTDPSMVAGNPVSVQSPARNRFL